MVNGLFWMKKWGVLFSKDIIFLPTKLKTEKLTKFFVKVVSLGS